MDGLTAMLGLLSRASIDGSPYAARAFLENYEGRTVPVRLCTKEGSRGRLQMPFRTVQSLKKVEQEPRMRPYHP